MSAILQPHPARSTACGFVDADETGVLDPAALERLHELDPTGRNAVVERVLRAFEGSLQRLLAQAVQAQAQGDHGAVRHVAHTLKSSSASVGALQLSQRCCDIENRLRAQPAMSLEASMQGFHLEGRRVLAAVRALLEGG